jgi:hypothetical protein
MKVVRVNNVKVLSEENSKMLADSMGWTQERAQGYVEGEKYRRQSLALSVYHKVGIDEFALGFRAAYYKRGDPFAESNPRQLSSIN